MDVSLPWLPESLCPAAQSTELLMLLQPTESVLLLLALESWFEFARLGLVFIPWQPPS